MVIEAFHFLRPGWLLLLIPLLLGFWLWLRARYDSGSWRAVIDARLLPHVLTGGRENRRRLMGWIYLGVGLCAIVALAGPTWEKLPQPVYQREASIVIALDLSRSMDATDVKPSRLARARHKIADILNLKLEGQSALVVYAADAFTVTPLTSDVDTILALLPGLDSELMPAQGSRADRAVALAFELFANAGVRRGDVLLVSDGLSASELERAQQLHRQHPGHRLSVLAIGTPAGGPIPLGSGGFLKHRDGSIVITGLREDNLRLLARSGDGVYATISSDDLDINTITYLFEAGIDDRGARQSGRSADLWREFGPALLLLSLPFAALAFRRGLVLGFAAAMLLPPAADALDWNALWQNPDQRARELFDAGEHAAAAGQFEDSGWRAAASYRAGDYAAALETWRQQASDDALYNRGNALAGMGRYPDALAAYEALLERDPGHEDARYNKQAIEDWLQQQQQQQQQGQQQGEQQRQQGQNSQQAQQNQQQQSQQSAENRSQQGAGAPPEPGQDAAQAPPREPSAAESRDPGETRARAGSAEAADDDADPERPASAEDELARIDRQMSAQAAEQWLRKIPDDPGGLLRRKFLYQYRKRGGVETEAQTW